MTDPAAPGLYPLRFREILRDYSFGNRWIAEAYSKTGLPEDHRIGETWEVCDRSGESSKVVNGILKGQDLHGLIAGYGERLLGKDIVARCGSRFPLLIKLLDASNVLGEQVHHNDELAVRRRIDDPGKTEAWYILKTRPGATIECGNRPGLNGEQLLRAILEGDVRSCMNRYPVAPDDAFLLHAGTMHYSDGGLLFFEIMQNSDAYISLAAPGKDLPPEEREKRARDAVEAVHLEEGFDCRTKPLTIQRGRNKRTFAIACQYFAVERFDLAEPLRLDLDGDRFYVLTQIEGEAEIVCGRSEVLLPGHTCLLPACSGEVVIRPRGTAALLKSYVPDLQKNVVAPLKAAGFQDADIQALGGRTILNPLKALL